MLDTSPAIDADALGAARAGGALARDPVRWRLAESLARRACAHAGAARRALDARLARLLDALSVSPEVAAPAATMTRSRGPLAELVEHAARQKSAPVLGSAPMSREPASNPPAAAPKTLQFFQRTWSRLSADQRLAQSRASLPENAGPLNSQHLVHRSLTLMRELSPDYLERFVGYVDALQWLEQSGEAAAQPAGARKTMAARR